MMSPQNVWRFPFIDCWWGWQWETDGKQSSEKRMLVCFCCFNRLRLSCFAAGVGEELHWLQGSWLGSLQRWLPCLELGCSFPRFLDFLCGSFVFPGGETELSQETSFCTARLTMSWIDCLSGPKFRFYFLSSFGLFSVFLIFSDMHFEARVVAHS